VLSAAVNTLSRLRFRRGLVCGSRGTSPLYYPREAERCDRHHRSAVRQRFIFWTTHRRNAFERWAGQGRALTPLLLHPKIDVVARDAIWGCPLYRPPLRAQFRETSGSPIIPFALN
jgi:hypothetical protein